MKPIYFLIVLVCFFVSGAFAQHTPPTIRFKSGNFNGSKNLLKIKTGKESLSKMHFSRKDYALLQFNEIPVINEKKDLASKGVLLFDYLSGNAYMA